MESKAPRIRPRNLKTIAIALFAVCVSLGFIWGVIASPAPLPLIFTDALTKERYVLKWSRSAFDFNYDSCSSARRKASKSMSKIAIEKFEKIFWFDKEILKDKNIFFRVKEVSTLVSMPGEHSVFLSGELFSVDSRRLDVDLVVDLDDGPDDFYVSNWYFAEGTSIENIVAFFKE